MLPTCVAASSLVSLLVYHLEKPKGFHAGNWKKVELGHVIPSCKFLF